MGTLFPVEFLTKAEEDTLTTDNAKKPAVATGDGVNSDEDPRPKECRSESVCPMECEEERESNPQCAKCYACIEEFGHDDEDDLGDSGQDF